MHEGQQYVIYIDPWLDNPNTPQQFKGSVPTDADLVLVSHGHPESCASAAPLTKTSSKPGVKLITIGDLHQFFELTNEVPIARTHRCNKGARLPFPWGEVRVVGADHSSSGGFHHGKMIDGGNPVAFIIKFNECGRTVYHSGDTGIFGEMKLIEELHEPDILLLCIGGITTMGPEEAAYSVCKFFKSAKTVVPMTFSSQ